MEQLSHAERVRPMEEAYNKLLNSIEGMEGSVVIGHKVKRSSHTVRKIIQQHNAEPALMFRLPVLHQRYKNRDRLFTCAFCIGEMLRVREKAAREHVASHIFTEEMIREGGVFFS